MGEVFSFNDAVKANWEADFIKRWKAHGDAGEYTNDIWAWQELLEEDGWIVQLDDPTLQDFATYVNFDKKLLTNRNVKAFHTQRALSTILSHMFAGVKGRWLYHWEEVHDDAHRNVRDGDEYKDCEDYMSVWYSRELFVREMNSEEPIPLGPEMERITLDI